MIEVMAVLYSNGQRSVNVGALMRLLGVPDSQASEHDDERIDMDDQFQELVKEFYSQQAAQSTIPAGATIH